MDGMAIEGSLNLFTYLWAVRIAVVEEEFAGAHPRRI
jgi:hypothetical protein